MGKKSLIPGLNLQLSTVEQVTLRVNGGVNGLTGRTNYYNKSINFLKW